MSQVSKFRIVTYNVHKCVGVDRRLDPARIVNVLKEINADIIALQVVLCIHGRNGEDDQAHFIARGLGFNYCMGHNRELKGGVYGNLALGRFSEWTRGLVTRLLNEHFRSGDIRLHLKRSRTYPGLLPFMHLDHIYFDETLELEHVELHRSRSALLASDHLPIYADFRPMPS